ncbi:PepSY domain-containing protein [Paenibacillus sp. MMS20-IR301]|uniref:PepSY domain-containing protein n=1 Tax=Paenibacillus sp. MMS20-IR301 TaxID=2895946 RepID=UPI0028E1A0EA|nr:PepSY domain-containing protein [Paenibacillus sp. MMS20-IR301]WNS41425.1 PepSY domain-containing protein [Paenibacillus sp. MMS20-IR301]
MRIRKPGFTKSKFKLLFITGIVLILVLAGLSLFRKESDPLLTEQQAKQALLKEYPGSIQSFSQKSGKYAAELQTLQGLYELQLDGTTGEIVSIILLKPAASAAVTPAPAPSSGTVAGGGTEPSLSPSAAPAPSASPQRVVSETEAVRLALQEVPGEADDVDTGIDESGAYYLVEVNTADGREAVVQVDAISGQIRSVAWEAPDDDS